MKPSENRCIELEKLLEDAYKVRIETQRLLSVTTNPTEYARLEIDLEKSIENIERLESELKTNSITHIVLAYLKALDEEFEKYDDIGNFIPLRMQPGKTSTSKQPPRPLRRDLEKFQMLLNPGYSIVPAPSAPIPDFTRPEVKITDFLSQHRLITLLGEPGAGKSTTLRHLIQFFGEPWKTTSNSYLSAPIPIFAALNMWHDPKIKLEEFLQQQITLLGIPALAAIIPELMKKGQLILLLDGLNELPHLQRDQQSEVIDDPRARSIAEIGEFPHWKEVSCVLTCRVKDFAGGPQWHDLHILDLTRKQVKDFAEAYYQGDSEAATLAHNLLNDLYDSKNQRKQKLRGLVSQPFYLKKLLAYYYYERSLPEHPSLLLKFSITEALEREIERNSWNINDAKELHISLEFLAFNMTNAHHVSVNDLNQAAIWSCYPHIQLPSDLTMEERRKAKFFWKLAQDANLLSDNGIAGVKFYHQLIQEYFCACYCKAHTLTPELLDVATYPQFSEIWPLWAGLDNNLVPQLLELIKQSKNKRVRRDAAWALRYSQDVRGLEPLLYVLEHTSTTPAGEIVLHTFNSMDESGVLALIELLMKDEDSFVRERAAYILGEIGDKRAIPPLIKTLRNDRDSFVRESAAYALGGFKDESVFEPLTTALEQDVDADVRAWAAYALGTLGDRRALPMLVQVLKNDNEIVWAGKRVSEIAARAIDIIQAG